VAIAAPERVTPSVLAMLKQAKAKLNRIRKPRFFFWILIIQKMEEPKGLQRNPAKKRENEY
jgi:hypothetical protein